MQVEHCLYKGHPNVATYYDKLEIESGKVTAQEDDYDDEVSRAYFLQRNTNCRDESRPYMF